MSKKVKFFLVLSGISFLTIVLGTYLITAGKTVGQSMFGRSFAEKQLQEYVAAVLKQEVNGARCQSVDTDGNGYVSCDYTTAARPDSPLSIECAAWGWDGFFNRGCKTRTRQF